MHFNLMMHADECVHDRHSCSGSSLAGHAMHKDPLRLFEAFKVHTNCLVLQKQGTLIEDVYKVVKVLIAWYLEVLPHIKMNMLQRVYWRGAVGLEHLQKSRGGAAGLDHL